MINDNLSKIEAILNWAEEHPSFDTQFVTSIRNQDRPLTPKQEQAIDNIIERFEIDVEEWL